MPITAAASVALTVVATMASAADGLPVKSMPPMAVSVRTEADLPPKILSIMLGETEAIWRGTGIQFIWEGEAASEHTARGDAARGDTMQKDASRARSLPPPLHRLGMLRVVIGHDTRSAQGLHLPLGWIKFENPTTPDHEIYLSYDNAVALLRQSSDVVGRLDSMPRLKRDTLIGRAMGRAFAHELGHYLSASKAHTDKGLMMAVHSAVELFGNDRAHFSLEPAERAWMMARFTSIYMASQS
jgi:hypothetical protein